MKRPYELDESYSPTELHTHYTDTTHALHDALEIIDRLRRAVGDVLDGPLALDVLQRMRLAGLVDEAIDFLDDENYEVGK